MHFVSLQPNSITELSTKKREKKKTHLKYSDRKNSLIANLGMCTLIVISVGKLIYSLELLKCQMLSGALVAEKKCSKPKISSVTCA